MVSRKTISKNEIRVILNFFQPLSQQLSRSLIDELVTRIDAELFYTELEKAKISELKDTLHENIDDFITLVSNSISEALQELKPLTEEEVEHRLEVALSIVSAVDEKVFELNLLKTMAELIHISKLTGKDLELCKQYLNFSCMALGYELEKVLKAASISLDQDDP